MSRREAPPGAAHSPRARRRSAPAAPWYVYIVRCADRSLYTGIATDVARRVAAHNAGGGARYTRSRLPVRLVYREVAADRSAALRREYAIKRMRAVAKRALIRPPR